MILTGKKIIEEVFNKNIIIEPFDSNQVSTNSYDLRLGTQFLKYEEEIIDPKKKPKYNLLDIPEDGLDLNPGDFILATSEEIIGSEKYVPIIHSKSGTARAGLFVHITADLIDIGSVGKTTFQLFATLPIKLFPRMLLGQVSFWKTTGDIELYDGKYQGTKEPMASLTYKDYK
ncbi:dCTP deaminase [Vibrio coralliilyticus]|uniref:dCTP deaminase n=1 Tax=Vibrio coralliilyticus TaxID=190893 RepID=UPI0015618654|nr:dCTP deaminase [Vibrio coralliilyticus]NRF25481.1 dCTP deaminase [Vibrio coralliilyticus]NRF79456.1 dCTP deaminase [Vibrio coralliilyticus]